MRYPSGANSHGLRMPYFRDRVLKPAARKALGMSAFKRPFNCYYSNKNTCYQMTVRLNCKKTIFLSINTNKS